MVGHTERIIVLERRLEELPRKERFDQHSRDLATIKEKTDRLQQQVTSRDGSTTVPRYGTLNAMAGLLEEDVWHWLSAGR